MNFLIDLLIILIFGACCVLGYRLGIVKMLVQFSKNIIGVIAASFFASRLGSIFYDKVFKSLFEKLTAERISGWLGGEADASPDVGPLIEAEHTEFFQFVQKLGFDLEAITEKYAELGGNAGDLLVEYIAQPIAVAVSNVIAFVLIFIVTVLAVQLVGFIVSRIAKLPVLNVTNRILGLLLGIVLGLVFIFVFAALVNAVVPFIKINGDVLTVGELGEGTIIYRFLLSGKPGELIGKLLELIGVK